jgi:DNA-binding transcriptional regulator YiaG
VARIEEAVRWTIMRLVRREVRGAVAPLAREVRELRGSVSRLRKGVSALERAAARQARQAEVVQSRVAASEVEVKAARLSPTLIHKLRTRLGLTQEQMAVLVGVSGSAVAQWEAGSIRPQGQNRAALVGLRKLGRRDVKRLLAARSAARRRKSKKARGRRG